MTETRCLSLFHRNKVGQISAFSVNQPTLSRIPSKFGFGGQVLFREFRRGILSVRAFKTLFFGFSPAELKKRARNDTCGPFPSILTWECASGHVVIVPYSSSYTLETRVASVENFYCSLPSINIIDAEIALFPRRQSI